jgi:hypothetical protein
MKRYVKRPWTSDERNLLKNKYYTSSMEELEQLFPDRSYNSIVKQVSYLKKRGWTFTGR